MNRMRTGMDGSAGVALDPPRRPAGTAGQQVLGTHGGAVEVLVSDPE